MTKIILSDEARRAIGERLQEIANRAKNIQLTLSDDGDLWSAHRTAEGIETICALLGDDLGIKIEPNDLTAESEDDDDITAW